MVKRDSREESHPGTRIAKKFCDRGGGALESSFADDLDRLSANFGVVIFEEFHKWLDFVALLAAELPDSPDRMQASKSIRALLGCRQEFRASGISTTYELELCSQTDSLVGVGQEASELVGASLRHAVGEESLCLCA